MKNVLVVSGHTDLNDSVVNKLVLEEVKKLIPEAEIDRLDELYPDFTISAVLVFRTFHTAQMVRADLFTWLVSWKYGR